MGILIAFGYKKFVGKDTVCNYLRDRYMFKRDAFADSLKFEVITKLRGTLLRWAYDTSFPRPAHIVNDDLFLEWLVFVAKPPFIVNILQEYGTQVRRADDPTYWVKKVINKWIKSGHYHTAISDMRFENEVLAVVDHGGIVVKIERDILRDEDYNTHISETELDSFNGWHHVIHNNGSLTDLFKQVDSIVEPLLRG